MGFLRKVLMGDGSFKPALRDELEAEGIVVLEEDLPGRIRYDRFRAPGKRFNGKVTREHLALAVTEARIVVYCRSGRTELIESTWDKPRLRHLEPDLACPETVALRIDYDAMGEPGVSGTMTISAETPEAPGIVEEMGRRVGPRRGECASPQGADRG